MHRLAIFASGSGTNAENIIRYFRNKPKIKVSCVCTNRADAIVIRRARKYGIDVLVFSRNDLCRSSKVIDYLKQKEIDWIILAGFLWLVPETLIHMYENRIMNIHPALLPKYGGKGMYGSHVHKAVVEHHDDRSGITIHLIDKEYDKGRILFQATCPVYPADSPEQVAERVHQLEYEHYPRIIEKVVLGMDKEP